MLHPGPETPFEALLAVWRGEPGRNDVEATRAALAAVCPGDLAAARPLADALLVRAGEPGRGNPARQALLGLLDGVRRRGFLSQLRPAEVEPWLGLVLEVLAGTEHTVGELLRSREETDPRTVAFQVLGDGAVEVTVAEVARRTRAIARGVLALTDGAPDTTVAILAENALAPALCDLACLTHGILVFQLPANAVAEQVVQMLRHSGARILIASDDEQVAKVLPSLSALPELEQIVAISDPTAARNGLLSLDQMVSQGADFDDGAREARAAAVKLGDVATVMYTSGTTGRPKGIVFTHLNLVSKRFCRAFALPDLGEGDVFLCYLPLYHTFGRWLEMLGTLFWGATYVFARSPAQASLLEDFRRVRPTAFISVPKKWMELHESAIAAVGTEDPEEVAGALRVITGGRLRHGLSAAGYLDPIVFRTFHRAGVSLCSGYGMTEATGGITMTPPGEYADDSIGLPLPGISCRRADDGELWVRGPYVSPGYHRPGPEDQGPDAHGWLPTGDLVTVDPAGHYRIVGRKKEIYKNRQGQTIAPARVESLFRDFEAISQAFLVGDHREYNTLLVWPNPESPVVKTRTAGQVRDLVSSMVASANRFLAPYERVVAFQILPRALDVEHGELTHKLSYRREQVEKNWKDLLDQMYGRRQLSLGVDGATLRVPNWLLREMGVLQHEVSVEGRTVRAGERSLEVGPSAEAPGAIQLGDMAYQTGEGPLDLGALAAQPALWIGNRSLARFLGDEAFDALAGRRRRAPGGLRIDPRVWRAPPAERLEELVETAEGTEATLRTVHDAAELMRAERPEARRAIAHLQLGMASPQPDVAGLCRAVLRRAADAPDEDVRRRAFRVLLPAEEAGETLSTLRRYLDGMGAIALRDEDLAQLGERGLPEAQIAALLAHLSGEAVMAPPTGPSDRALLVGTMRLLTATAIAHPMYFAQVRVPLARLSLHDDPGVAARAAEELDRLRRGFAHWVGPNLRLAIDPATGAEYGWRHVLTFDDSVPSEARMQLLQALEDATIVRASVFLLARGVLISLADLPPGGAAVALLGRHHGISVYRLTLNTRSREVFDLTIHSAEGMGFAELRREISWLLASGAPQPLLERFGGYFSEWGIFTMEYLPGRDVMQQIARIVNQGEAARLGPLWPFWVRTALELHVRFWDRAGRVLALREPSPAAFVVPSHDYQVGARLAAVSDRATCRSLDELLDRFRDAFRATVESAHPGLQQEIDPREEPEAVVEALGEERGAALLEASAPGSPREEVFRRFLSDLRERGFTPQRVRFAARRFRRWLEEASGATVEAQGRMLHELWSTYHLDDLEGQWPDTRIRFFRLTVFADARPELCAALDRLMGRARALRASGLELAEQVAQVRAAIRSGPAEDYFLARMTYRYLAPGDDVALISVPSGGHLVAEVVAALVDGEGSRYTVRAPVSPREVSRLLGIFHESNLHVTFTAEHEFLVALDAREVPIAGIYWHQVSPGRAHMDKLVVARRHRGKGVADGLMGEFTRRLVARGYQQLGTGFFHPEYLRRFGFRTDPLSGGLVRSLRPEAPAPARGS
jgi:long-subunit acyl-CoA synthetase (AMP-forming)/ribosomal protein S18 acetylase RimI-like enzyme